MYIISIDIGLNNLGIVGGYLNNINLCKKVDIKALCQYCAIKNCGLYHNLCMSDYVSHFIQGYQKYLNMADIILIERQPPCGFISIQELFVFQYRDKVKMISPNSVHKYFDITHYNYNRRKEFVTLYAENALKMFPDFKDSERKHDVSDAYCMIIFYLHTAPSGRRTPPRRGGGTFGFTPSGVYTENRTKATTLQEKTKLNLERFNYIPKEAPKGRVKSRFFQN